MLAHCIAIVLRDNVICYYNQYIIRLPTISGEREIIGRKIYVFETSANGLFGVYGQSRFHS